MMKDKESYSEEYGIEFGDFNASKLYDVTMKNNKKEKEHIHKEKNVKP